MREKPSPKEVINALKSRALVSPAFNAMSCVFASRERTRQQLNVTSMANALKKEGFSYSKAQYRRELEFLAGLGLGVLDKNQKGVTRTLKGIKVTLQSIGKAAINKDTATLAPYQPHPTFQDLPATKEPSTVPAAPRATLTLYLGGTRFTFDFVPVVDVKNALTMITEICGGNAKGVLKWDKL